jgi:hypothetical protein
MDPTTALSMILSLIPDHLITSGGRLIRAGLNIGGSYISGETLNRILIFMVVQEEKTFKRK